MCSLKYSSVDAAAEIIAHLGQGALLAKIDIAHAYRNIPAHPQDRHLLGMMWDSSLYVDTVLPFGLRSAPKIFSLIADTLEWILIHRGVKYLIHYLDDFLTAGSPNSKECYENLRQLTQVCQKLGLPLAMEKVEGPVSILVFLGILLNSTKMTMKLPPDKLAEIKLLIHQWLHKKAATKREMLSLIGHLAYATKVVTPGRTFLRRMIELSTSCKKLDRYIRFNSDFHSDLLWWHFFLDQWNGVSCLKTHTKHNPDFIMFTDASGHWGCGAIQAPFWFHYAWSVAWHDLAIATKEMLPIVMAVALWGRRWTKSHMLVKCDNMAVVNILHSQTSKEPVIMHLLRSLHFFLPYWDIRLWAEHVPGKENIAADELSHNLQVFHNQVSNANQEGTAIPQALVELLVSQRPDWASPNWRHKFRNLLTVV